MNTLLTSIKKELSNGTDVAFNKNVVYGMNGSRTTLVIVTKIGEPVKEMLWIHDDLRINTTGMTEQEILKLI